MRGSFSIKFFNEIFLQFNFINLIVFLKKKHKNHGIFLRLAACSVMGFNVDLTEMIMIMGLVFSKNVPQSRAWWIMLITLTFQRHAQKGDLSWDQPGEERKS